MPEAVTRFSVSVDPELMRVFDEVSGDLNYSRSSAVQIAMRDFLTEHNWKNLKGDVVGAITILYDHHVKGLGDELTNAQHDYYNAITSTTHVHLDHQNCLEILVVKGSAREIDELARKVYSMRGIKQIKLSILMP